jgi:AraC-like DNA-binding protein
VYNLPTGFYNTNNSAVLMLIDTTNIVNTMGAADGNGLFLLDENGQVIIDKGIPSEVISEFKRMSRERQEEPLRLDLPGIKGDLIYHKNADTNWTFARFIPDSFIAAEVWHIKRTYITSVSILLFTGILLSLYFALRNSKPLVSLLTIFSDGSQNIRLSELYNLVETTLTDLKKKNQYLREERNKYAPIISAFYIRKLFDGTMDGEELPGSELNYLVLRGATYITVILRVINGKASKEMKKKIESINHPCSTRVISIGPDSIGLLFINDQGLADFSETIKDHAETIYHYLEKPDSAEFMISIGDEVDNALMIHASYCSALRKFGTEHFQKKDIAIAGDIYFYPLDMENKIINLVRAGQWDPLKKIIEDIYFQNYIQRQIPQRETIRLFNAFDITLCRLNEYQRHKAAAQPLTLYGNIEPRVFFDQLLDYLHSTCETVEKNKKSHNTELINKMIQFIRENYTDINFNLQMVADEFGISIRYCSDFFLEQRGENFSSFVENLRMTKIQELMANRDKNISLAQIGQSAGYYNVNTFYKAFKRKFGVTPSSFWSKNS